MTDIIKSTVIQGVKLVRLSVFADDRGQFMELFRKDWFPERTWDIVQSNRSDSKAGVLRSALSPLSGRLLARQRGIRVGLADLRQSSPTRGGRRDD